MLHAFNFEEIDLPILYHSRPPIVLTRLDAVEVYTHGENGKPKFFYFPFEKVTHALVNSTISGEGWYRLHVSYESIMRKSRPWMCEAHVFILPPWFRKDSMGVEFAMLPFGHLLSLTVYIYEDVIIGKLINALLPRSIQQWISWCMLTKCVDVDSCEVGDLL